MRYTLFALLIVVAACSDRGTFSFAPADPAASAYDIFVANFRPTDPPATGDRSPPRPSRISYEKYRMSVPPTHEPGTVAWPKGTPNAATDMVSLSHNTYDDMGRFVQSVRSEIDEVNEVMVFVHGYNTNHAEAVHLLTQVSHDFQVPVPTVLFSWPSAARAVGYLYDRDSVLIARDQLEDLLVALSQRQKVVIMAHSMGNLLVMETLRQIGRSRSMDIRNDISALFMISPDIDGELFFTQAASLPSLPQYSVVLAAEQDIALRVSAFLTGRSNRLGSDIDRTSVGDLPITVVDVSAFSDGGLEHKVALASPAAIAVLSRLNLDTLPGDDRFDRVVRVTPEGPDAR
ncbi:MAG: alpha/beta fold hydrolase [Pseudomonadota bacterium]